MFVLFWLRTFFGISWSWFHPQLKAAVGWDWPVAMSMHCTSSGSQLGKKGAKYDGRSCGRWLIRSLCCLISFKSSASAYVSSCRLVLLLPSSSVHRVMAGSSASSVIIIRLKSFHFLPVETSRGEQQKHIWRVMPSSLSFPAHPV